MSGQDFVQSVEAPDSLAEKAWDLADGDEGKARGLLEESKIWFKGMLVSESDSMSGYFLVGIDKNNRSIESISGAVLNAESADDISLGMGKRKFNKNIEYLLSSSRKMNASTQQLNEILSENWKSGSELMKSAIAGEFEKLNESLHEIFDSEFDFKVNDTTIDAEKERKIHSKQKTSSSTSQSTTRDKPEESEDIVLPCDAEITPVKGVPAAKLSSGDKIFVDIGKVDSKDKKIKARLEATKDQKTDMVPTTIISKESSGPGKFRLKTQFADNVYGKVSCGNDVSIRVPEEVLNRYQNKSDGDIVAMLEENKMALAVGIGVIVFLVVAAWLFGLL